LKDFPAVVRKASDRLAHSALELDAKKLLFRGRSARGFERRERGFARDDSLVPDVIQRAIAGGPDQIRAKGLLDIQRFTATPQFEHYVLRNLLCQGTLAHD
jgi:hypothetical protein